MITNERIEGLLSQVRKPARYLGNEWNAVRKDLDRICLKFALAFPDLYEVGMSNLGYKLLYHLLNRQDGVACERVFSPGLDMEELLRKDSLPIFTLESKKPLRDFDILGFSLSYELNYTNMLNILDLANIPLKASARDADFPLIIAGGPSVFNPEPICDFIDLFLIGEAEETLIEIINIVKDFKTGAGSRSKDELLERLSCMAGIYVPRFYKAEYKEDGVLSHLTPILENVPKVITKRKIANLDESFYPVEQLVPFINIVHDRASIEIMRGCPHLCRFCQARSLYYPKRERSTEKVLGLSCNSLENTGYEEVSLLSLSSGSYSGITKVISSLIDKFYLKGVGVSLPSLRIDKILKEFPALLSKVKKSGLTFAPEAGTERLRAVINKKIKMEELISTIDAACKVGWNRVKLYFMIGLPTEKHEDLDGIITIIQRILSINKRICINVSINVFIPKPHTPFQWAHMNTEQELAEKISYIKKNMRPPSRRVKLKFQDLRLSFLEGIFSQGDRRLGNVIRNAFKRGCRFDGWIENLNFEAWKEAFKDEGVDPAFYLFRKKIQDERLPWAHINCGVDESSLIKEWKRAEAV